jgi:hypothetical protein
VVWFKRFVDSYRDAKRARLLTPRDAAEYITAVPKAEHDAADWQVAWSPRAIGRNAFANGGAAGLDRNEPQ